MSISAQSKIVHFKFVYKIDSRSYYGLWDMVDLGYLIIFLVSNEDFLSW